MSEKELTLKELELNSLLEATQAINANLPEESLYKIYYFTLLANLNIPRLALFVKEEDGEWYCKVNYGTEKDYYQVTPDKPVTDATEIWYWEEHNKPAGFEAFDMLIPVKHKDRILAYVLIGGEVPSVSMDISFVQTFSNIILVAIENKRLAREKLAQEGMRKEMEIAGEVQNFLFPNSLPYNNTLKVHASYYPHKSIGGDYYDYIPLDDNRFILAIADVSGKGIPAALIMSNFQASLRTLLRKTEDLQEIVQELNLHVRKNAGDHFITFFIGMFDLNQQYLYYINAGHNPPFIYSSGRGIELLETGCTILGPFDPLPFIQKGETRLDNNPLFVGYTDGLIETSNTDEEEFGENRLYDAVKAYSEQEPKALHDDIFEDLKQFSEGRNFVDDITLLTCKM